MTSPKRAEPANEHARNLGCIAYDLDGECREREASECRAAAAEIERLAATVEALTADRAGWLEVVKNQAMLMKPLELNENRIREIAQQEVSRWASENLPND